MSRGRRWLPSRCLIGTVLTLLSIGLGWSLLVASAQAAGFPANLGVRAALIQVAPSTTSLLVSPASAVTNQPVALVAAVSSPAGSPSGTVSFDNGGTPIPGCASQSITPTNTIAVCQASFGASASPAQVTAVFTPDANSTAAGSSSNATTLPISPDTIGTSLEVSSSPVTVGSSVTYTASVTPAHRGPLAPSGSVQFVDGGNTIAPCANQPLQTLGGSAAATCTRSYARTGMHAITAVYNGDSNFSASTSRVAHVPVQVLGTIASTMQWIFRFSPSYTLVQSLVVTGTPVGTEVGLKCDGRGCPFKLRKLESTVKRCSIEQPMCRPTHPRALDLTRALRNHRLLVGTRLIVAITRPGWIGKHYAFVMRASKIPSVRLVCLAPGVARPGKGC